MEFKRSFSLWDAYRYLQAQGLAKESEEIRNSTERYKSKSSPLRRAKIITLVRDKNLLVDFCNTVWPSGLTDKGKSRIKFFETLFQNFYTDPQGLRQDDEVEDDLSVEENEFAYENDLRNYLVRNLSAIEKGLKIYEVEGIDGEEFYIPGSMRRIDVLAVDSQNTFVVIELKVSRGYEKVVGQALFYQSSIKTIFNREKVRAIIVAREITAELKTATKYLPDFELFEYHISFNLTKVCWESEQKR